MYPKIDAALIKLIIKCLNELNDTRKDAMI